jgi:hypothetical protein
MGSAGAEQKDDPCFSRCLPGRWRCFADGASHYYVFMYVLRFVERSQPWPVLSVALSELIV